MDQDIVVSLILKAMAFNQGAAQGAQALQTLTTETKKLDDGLKAVDSQIVKTVQTQVTQAEQLKRVTVEVERLTNAHKAAEVSSHGLSDGMGGLAHALEALALGEAVAKLYEFGKAAVEAAEHMNQLRLATAAIVASNETITDSTGKVITGVAKIQAATAQTSAVFNQLQLDAMKTTDTTQGLIEKFEAMSAAGLAMGLTLTQLEKLTLSFSATTSVLGIKGQQARTEIKDLFEGVRLGQSQLAIGLKIKEEDIKLAKEQGRLYEFLQEKTKDFVAANQLQARTLTGVSSSLQDFREILLRIAGERATDTLTSGFGELLDAIVDADGKLTPLGNDMTIFAHDAGVAINDVIGDLALLARAAVTTGIAIATALQQTQLYMKQEAVDLAVDRAIVGAPLAKGVQGPQQPIDPAFAMRSTLNIQAKVDDLKQQRETAANGGSLFGLGKDPSKLPGLDKQIAVGERLVASHKQAKLDGREAVFKDLIHPDLGKGLADDIRRLRFKATPPRPEREKKHRGAGHHTDPATKGDDEAMRRLERNMEHELHRSDLTERIGSLTSEGAPLANDDRKLGILEKYRVAVQNAAATADDAGKKREAIEAIDRKIEDLKVQRTLDQAKATKEATDKQDALNVAIATGRGKNDDAAAAREFDHIKETNKAAQEVLKDRFSDGVIKAEEYYTKLATLRNLDIDAEIAAERRKLSNQREEYEEKFKKASGKTGKEYKPADVEALRLDISGTDAALQGLDQKSNDRKAVIGVESAKGIEDATEKATKAGLTSAIDSLFGGSIDPLKKSMETSFREGLLNSLKDTSVGKALGEVFKDGSTSGIAFGAAAIGWSIVKGIADAAKSGSDARFDSGYTLPREISDRTNPFGAVESAALKRKNADIDRFRSGNSHDKGFAGIFGMADQRLTPEQQASVDAQQSNEINQGDMSVKAGMVSQTISELKQLVALGLMTNRDAAATLRGMSNGSAAPTSEAGKQELTRQAATFELDQTTSVIEGRKALEQKGAAVIEATWRTTFMALDAMQKASVEAWAINLQKLKRDQDAAAKSMTDSMTISEVQGVTSKASDVVIKALTDEQAARTTRQKHIDESNAVNGTLGSLRDQFVGGPGQGPLLITSTSTTGADGIKYLGGKDAMQTGIAANDLPGGLDSLSKLIASGEVYVYGKDGKALTSAGLRTASQQAADAPGLLKTANDGIINSNLAITAAQSTAGIDTAGTNQDTKVLNRDLAIQIRSLKAGLSYSVADKKAEEKAKIDDQVAQQKLDTFQKTGTHDQDEKLDEIARLMKAEVDKRYTDMTPLPVRVVEMPKLYAAPTSSYFQARAMAPNITLGAGAIQINGSGLDATQTQTAITKALLGVIGPLSISLTREADTQSKRVAP